ncbi:glucosamine-6-phosphate deaminase [Roseiconus lacunae]|uniref:Glucosamine-6-phosphate deaminase n=1 Tax=Roseiconus lacunae TaxID=2605694 RepID=A0ABT7PS50_9BACT|nr:glucosamine-6-phosphate deaminase [Roseiconus lacunae]MCD0459235.1 glucosamine-6-phosphate deaminase [Roseiconus lacunae]MDM4019345.1 glucosamine-6-phosphate deaminase [Roseiconus lacunae]WRQ53662.1 glucosamine-6-phosphate deaminase [Stieleria sp. HD01]
MKTIVAPNAKEMGRYAAEHAAANLRQAIADKGKANLIVATGASQFEVLDHLVSQDGIDWSRVDGFHLDEYVGIGNDHPASFCRYLKERFVDRVPLASFLFLDGKANPAETIQNASEVISQIDVDVAMVGIGENGHLAFNDPPADFETEQPYLLVELDEPCRLQQVGEGWFGSLEEVPTHAISMSVKQILKTKHIYCSVPDERKASAVSKTLSGPVTPDVPASILADHPGTTLVIDEAAASQIPASAAASLGRVQ